MLIAFAEILVFASNFRFFAEFLIQKTLVLLFVLQNHHSFKKLL